MDLRTRLLQEKDKIQLQAIALEMSNDKPHFDALMQLFLDEEYRIVQRAAWIVSLVADLDPGLVEPYLPVLAARMQIDGLPPAVRRNAVRILQHVVIPEALHGEVMNACFGFLADPKEHIAVRCFSMTVLGNLSKLYPEIKPELITILEGQLEQGASAGFRSRAKRTMQQARNTSR